MSDQSKEIVEQAKRLPVWARLLIGAGAVGLILIGVLSLTRQASASLADATVVGLILAAWVLAYLCVRWFRKRPPR